MMSSPTFFPYAASLARLKAGQPLELPIRGEVQADSPERYASLRELLLAAENLHGSREQISQVADILRRDQKFARPGAPSPHLVRLRQQQAAARQAGNQAQLAYVKAAQALARAWSLTVPPRLALEAYVSTWLARNLQADRLVD